MSARPLGSGLIVGARGTDRSEVRAERSRSRAPSADCGECRAPLRTLGLALVVSGAGLLERRSRRGCDRNGAVVDRGSGLLPAPAGRPDGRWPRRGPASTTGRAARGCTRSRPSPRRRRPTGRRAAAGVAPKPEAASRRPRAGTPCRATRQRLRRPVRQPGLADQRRRGRATARSRSPTAGRASAPRRARSGCRTRRPTTSARSTTRRCRTRCSSTAASPSTRAASSSCRTAASTCPARRGRDLLRRPRPRSRSVQSRGRVTPVGARRRSGVRRAQRLTRVGRAARHDAPRARRSRTELGVGVLRCFCTARSPMLPAGARSRPRSDPRPAGRAR